MTENHVPPSREDIQAKLREALDLAERRGEIDLTGVIADAEQIVTAAIERDERNRHLGGLLRIAFGRIEPGYATALVHLDTTQIGRAMREVFEHAGWAPKTGDEQPEGEIGGYVHVQSTGVEGTWAPKSEAVWKYEAKAREWCPPNFRTAALHLLPEENADA